MQRLAGMAGADPTARVNDGKPCLCQQRGGISNSRGIGRERREWRGVEIGHRLHRGLQHIRRNFQGDRTRMARAQLLEGFMHQRRNIAH